MIACYLVPTVQLGLICCVWLSFGNLFLLARAVSRGMRLQMHLYRGTKALPLELPLEPARAVKREEVVDPSCPLRQQMRTDKVHVLLSV